MKEIPYEFRGRHAGESKLDSQAMWGYLMLLADKFFGGAVPLRFVAFVLVGGIGVLVHFAVLTVLFRAMSLPFIISQACAVMLAMAGNYSLNNALTFRDMRLRGWRWVKGYDFVHAHLFFRSTCECRGGILSFQPTHSMGVIRAGRNRCRRSLELRDDGGLYVEKA